MSPQQQKDILNHLSLIVNKPISRIGYNPRNHVWEDDHGGIYADALIRNIAHHLTKQSQDYYPPSVQLKTKNAIPQPIYDPPPKVVKKKFLEDYLTRKAYYWIDKSLTTGKPLLAIQKYIITKTKYAHIYDKGRNHS